MPKRETPRDVNHMYGDYDLSTLSIFAGDFINFGYWAAVDLPEPLELTHRIRSQQDMYRLVLDALRAEPEHRVLEVGSGIGVGTALAVSEYGLTGIRGLDVSPAQVARARAAHPQLTFEVGTALAIPHPDSWFDRLYSVEAAQHFGDLAAFAREAYRVLRPGGRFTVATFFLTRDGVLTELAGLLETVDNGSDIPAVIGAFRTDLKEAGFTDVHIQSIGANVWKGLDSWIAQTEYHDSWARNWLTAHHRGLIDYYLVTADMRRPITTGSWSAKR